MTIGSLLSSGLSNVATSQASTEEIEKQASLEFFSHLCQQEGIDPSRLNDEQLEQVFKVAMDIKAAAEAEEEGEKDPKAEGKKAPDFGAKHEAGESKKDEKKEEAKEKEAAAVREWSEKRAAAVKVAEADATGRIMAHSFVDELNKLAQQQQGARVDDNSTKVANLVAAHAASKTASAVAPAVSSDTPNFDELAAYRAIELLKQAGHPEDEAYSRIDAAYKLGLGASTKIASAADVNAALDIRALEYCAAAKYDVDWSQV